LHFFQVYRSIRGVPREERLGGFEAIVLLAVARLDGEGYGVTVRREIEERTGRAPALAAVYATLARLEEKGCVRSREGEKTPVRGGRARRHFELTALGARALREAREAQERLWEGLDLGKAGRSAR
jgi:PadR family transcriptional regulator, regulatory protein PadR